MSDRTRALLANSADILRLDFRQTELPLPRPRHTREQRFWSKVDKSAGPDGCWRWRGSIHQADGYGTFCDTSPLTGKSSMRPAHRVAWEVANCRRPRSDEHILHARGCSKLCCNPKHLRVGTAAENTADARAEGRLGSKLDAGKVLKIVALRKRYGLENWVLAERFGVSCQTINSILKGKTWGKVTGIQDVPRKNGRPPKLVVNNDAPPSVQPTRKMAA